MNDFSVAIFNYVRDVVRERYPGCLVTSAPLNSDRPQLPALTIRFSFPSADEATFSSGGEVFTRTVCDAEAYSGTSAAEARGILALADDAMGRCGFRRSNYTEVANADQTIRRYAIKWRGSVDRDGNVARW